jgi:glycosyltransferase involved in cell wall biosynthesis
MSRVPSGIQIVAIVNSWWWKLTRPFRSMNSNSKRIASLARRLWQQPFGRTVHLFGTFARTSTSHGIRYALSKARAHLRREAEHPVSVEGMTLSNQERYLMEKSAQNNYLTNSLANSLEATHFDLIHESLASRAVKWDRLVIYPLSYPIELTQRPNHIFRALAENGYQCIVLSIDANAPFFREIAPNVHLTNLFAAVISYLSNKQVILYITYPFYSYIPNHLRPSTVVYDVLDDLSVFSLNCEAMKSDHSNLLESSDVVLFSSQELLNTNRDAVRGRACLVTNGVWVKDFVLESDSRQRKADFRRHRNEYVIGYHGAITELLDWELLENLAQMPGVRLVLIGPIAHFDSVAAGDSQSVKERVLTCDQVTHIQTVPYFELKYYLAGFDAGIVPFVINEQTAPVSPLKLFEYMAMGLKVFATPTKTLSAYAEFITVAESSRILVLVQEAINNRAIAECHIDYSKVLNEVDWGTQLKPVIALLEERTASSSPKSAKTVDIVNVNFYDWDGATLYKGGAERYVYDLASILKEDGWSPRILQVANRSFEKQFRGIPVIGVETGNGHNLRRVSKAYREVCRDSDLVIASPGDLACELSGLKVIAINHGIHWDHKYKSLESAAVSEYRNIFDALKRASAFVAVDTNFINWVRTYDYTLAQKLTYIPNYFDGKVFFPTPKNFEGNIRILYPRRLYEPRGIFITLKAFHYLFQKHGGIELHLVGQANAEDARIVSEFCAQYEGRVIWEELDREDMCKAYRASHIVLIPTLYAEGTSLSCLEAMATNNAIIATHIGGLPNLVVDGFNGFLISPTAEALIRSVESLLVDRGLMQSMASKGIELVAAFEKNRWSCRWRSIITEMTG